MRRWPELNLKIKIQKEEITEIIGESVVSDKIAELDKAIDENLDVLGKYAGEFDYNMNNKLTILAVVVLIAAPHRPK